MERGSHLRAQQDSAEYQKPLTIFQIPGEVSSTPEQGESVVGSGGRDSEQPAGWTEEMTAFVEGSLCGGNDVKTTADHFRLENPKAFDILGLEDHIEKLKNEYVNKRKRQVQ